MSGKNYQRFLNEDTYKGDIKDPLSLNYYSYCHGNPIMYADPSGNDVILLNDRNAAAYFGHNAVLVGTNKTGWKFFAKDGSDITNRNFDYGTFEQFFKDEKVSERFDYGYHVKTSLKQDKIMKEYGEKNYNKPYAIISKLDKFT